MLSGTMLHSWSSGDFDGGASTEDRVHFILSLPLLPFELLWLRRAGSRDIALLNTSAIFGWHLDMLIP